MDNCVENIIGNCILTKICRQNIKNMKFPFAQFFSIVTTLGIPHLWYRITSKMNRLRTTLIYKNGTDYSFQLLPLIKFFLNGYNLNFPLLRDFQVYWLSKSIIISKVNCRQRVYFRADLLLLMLLKEIIRDY